MDAIEKRARELLAEQYRNGGASVAASEILAGRSGWPNQMALAAIRAALTPPEGYVLVPVEPTEAMLAAGGDAEQIHVEWGVDPYVENSHEVWGAMLAARPEVP